MWQNASSLSIKAKSKTYFFQGDFAHISKEEEQRIKSEALSDPMGKVRYCLHQNPDNLLHYMYIGICKGTYVRPHRHIKSGKCYQIISGIMEVLLFDSDGTISNRFKMDAENIHSSHVLRLSPDIYHTEIYLSEVVVFSEVIAVVDTFELGKESNPSAPWAPDESDEQACQEYLVKLLDINS